MKIRSPLELNTALSDDLSWRKKELTTVRQSIQIENRPHLKEMLRRAAVLLLYAHWEGFVKRGATFYLELVARQKLKYSELRSNFVALACKRALLETVASNASHVYTQVVDFLLYNQDEVASVPYQGVVETRSNLSSDVLREICHLVGVQYHDDFATKELLLDAGLLRARNRIAHGDWEGIDDDTYDSLHQLVISHLSLFKDLVENAASLCSYRAH